MAVLAPPALTAARALARALRIDTAPANRLDGLYSQLAAAVSYLGGAEAVLDAIRAGELALPAMDGGLLFEELVQQACAEAARDLATWARESWTVLPFEAPAYPPQLREIADAPPVLFVEGELEPLWRPAGVAVVGTRSATEHGLHEARRAATVLVDAGLAVISGMAAGIDGAAHTAALDAGGVTVAVMGTPIHRRYPAAHSGLAARIVDHGGALVSEFVPLRATKPIDFLRRNKTMSGLAVATFVIEASETSGAKKQAEAAVQHGRPVFLLDSLVHAHEWARRLVEQGIRGVHATAVRDAHEVVAAFTASADLGEPIAL